MPATSKRRLTAWGLAGLVILCLVAAILFHWISGSRQSVELSDGATLRLLGTSQGTNEFRDGSVLSRLLDERIPAQGIEIVGLTLKRPRTLTPPRHSMWEDAPLTVWVQLIPAEPGQGPLYFSAVAGRDDWRIIADNRSGRRMENPHPLQRIMSDGVILAIPLHAFPRDERTFQLHILRGGRFGEPRDHAKFEIANPFRPDPPAWAPEPMPVTNRIEDLEVVLTVARVSPTRTDVRTVPNHIRLGFSPPDWHLLRCRITDHEGNLFPATRIRHPRAGSALVEFRSGLEYDQPWRIETEFVQAPDWPMGRLTDFPESERITVKLNSIREVSYFTNAIGREFICWLDGNGNLCVSEQTDTPPHFIVLQAEPHGRLIQVDGGPYGAQYFGLGMTQRLSLDKPVTNLTVVLASPKIVSTRFYVRPGK
jgi:hypothetical protein